MNVEIGAETRYSFSGNICFEISVFCLCSLVIRQSVKWLAFMNHYVEVAVGGGLEGQYLTCVF
jgi:hypothetical protein